MQNVESCPKATGARLCNKAIDVEPRIKVSSKADRATFVTVAKSPLIITRRLPDPKLGKMPTRVVTV